MANSEPTPPVQRFTTLLQNEWAKLDPRRQTELDPEDLLDIFWLAQHLQPETQPVSTLQQEHTPTPTQAGDGIVSPPRPPDRDPKVSVYTPPTNAAAQTDQPGLGAGLPLQVPAANALRSQLDLSRALRPLMRKIPSPTQCLLDEAATVVQIAEQGVWSPVLARAPERWFDLAIVVEASPSLKLWEDSITELQALVEQQGAFRQIRTWSLQGKKGDPIEVCLNWQPTATPRPPRPAKTLIDPTRRRIIWLLSDCTSDRWDHPAIYQALEQWGKYSPLAIVQLFPERLWARTGLGIGQPMRLHAAAPGATQAILSAKATPIDPVQEEHSDDRRSKIILPVISLEPEPLHRWATVTAGVGDASVAGLQIFLDDLMPQPSADAATPAATPLTPEQRVQQFCATASITAQKLAGLMAAVPVSLPVVHLIQKTLLPQSRQVHVAEVFMGGLLDAHTPASGNSQPTHYYFPEPVREKLIDAVPISKTIQVLDTVSAYISERLGLGIKSFTVLIASLAELGLDQQQTIQPFAEIGLSTLRRLGGEHRARADRLAACLTPAPPIDPPSDTPQSLPPLQEHSYQVATVEVEPLQRFDFETAVISPQPQNRQRQRRTGQKLEWLITKSPGYGWQRLEDLGNGVQLELVEIIGGSFRMGSPEDEPERYEDESPQHEVTLNDFFIGKYLVTQAQWRAVASLPAVKQELDPDPAHFKGENCPVEQVSWEDAVEFCARLSIKTGREYGLPTEAEWEYACRASPMPTSATPGSGEVRRAGTVTPFHFGEMITPDLANYDGDSTYNDGPKGVSRGKTTPVGSFPANAFGLFDLHGNVWEWCADDWHDSYADKPEALKENGNLPWLLAEPLAAEEVRRSLRGGSWVSAPSYCRSAIRVVNHPGVRDGNGGFRVVCHAARTLS